MVSSGGEGALSLIGLISSGAGGVGDFLDLNDPGKSTFFHFVEEAEVLIGDGLGGRRLFVGVIMGARCSENLGGRF